MSYLDAVRDRPSRFIEEAPRLERVGSMLHLVRCEQGFRVFSRDEADTLAVCMQVSGGKSGPMVRPCWPEGGDARPLALIGREVRDSHATLALRSPSRDSPCQQRRTSYATSRQKGSGGCPCVRWSLPKGGPCTHQPRACAPRVVRWRATTQGCVGLFHPICLHVKGLGQQERQPLLSCCSAGVCTSREGDRAIRAHLTARARLDRPC